FFLRNNDPGVDGFVLSTGAGGTTGLPLAITPGNYGIAFLRTFTNGTTLPSLNILDALGSWGYDNLSVYNFAIQYGESSQPRGIDYLSITVRRVCPADYDGNGVVQPADVAAFVNVWASSLAAGTLDGDFDGNGAVQPADVAAFINAWSTALSG